MCLLTYLLYSILCDLYVLVAPLHVLFTLFMYVFLLVCLCHQELLQILISCRFTPIFIHKISRLLAALLVRTNVVPQFNSMDLRTLNPKHHLSLVNILSLCLLICWHAFCRGDRPRSTYLCIHWARGPIRGH